MVDQPKYNTGISLPQDGEKEWYQSFTATMTCKLKKIAFGRDGILDKISVNVIIREGEGTTNKIIYKGTWTNMGTETTLTEYVITSDVNLTNNQKYSIQLTWINGNQYKNGGLLVNTKYQYKGGQFYSSDYGVYGDLMMQIWVVPEPEPGSEQEGLTLMVAQPNYNAGIALPQDGEKEWYQSFTATTTCKLKKIAFARNGLLDKISVNVIIHEGEGTTNKIIYKGTWTIMGKAITMETETKWTEYVITSDVNLTKSKQYSIQLTYSSTQSGGGFLGNNNESLYKYYGGQFYSSDYGVYGDLMMQIWVEPKPETVNEAVKNLF